MKKMLNIAVCVGFAALLAGCEDAPPAAVTTELSFDQVRPVALDVGRIDVADKYVPPMKPPNVEHLFRQTPDSVAHDMIEKGLSAQGTGKTLRITIDDASVTEKDLPVNKGIQGMFSQQPAEKYAAHVALRFELVNDDAPDVVIGHAHITSDHEKTLMNDASPADRDLAFFNLDEVIRDDIAAGFNSSVKEAFGKKF